MSDYTEAPATRMLATHCAACGRPLLDAKSVEIGLGPDCRKRLGFDRAVDEAARQEANRIVYNIALAQTGEAAIAGAETLRNLGFEKLADRILERVVDISIRQEGDTLIIKAPYKEEALVAWRSVPGREWKGAEKLAVYPRSSRRAIFEVLCRFYSGALAVGPKGPFVVRAI